MIVALYSAINLFWILCNSGIINFCQFTLYCFVRPWDRGLYRHLMAKFVQALWIDTASSCFPRTTLVLTGDFPTDKTNPAIIIANHQVDADWWYIWQAARAANGAGNIKIVLKEQLKFLPIIGWGMRLFEFLFLRRNAEHDAAHIHHFVKDLIRTKFPFWLVIFPEGTTIHKEYVEKSKSFAKRSNRPNFSKLLLPRTTGLQIILDASEEVAPDIYDMTIGYPSYTGEIPTYDMGYGREIDVQIPSMKALLAGNGPNHVFIHCKKFSYEEVKNWKSSAQADGVSGSTLEAFLDSRWEEKEERLNEFILKHRFLPRVDENEQIVELSSSVAAVFRLWFGVTLSCCLLPIVMLTFFPIYTVWVVFLYIYSIFDRTTRSWWPYILDLVTGQRELSEIEKED